MDAFKGAELARMAAGGNKPFQEFFDGHASNTKDSRTFEASSIQERYDSEAGDEWKERLSCKVECREFDKSNLPKRLPKKENAGGMGSGAPLSGRASAAGSRSHTPLSKTRSNDIRSSSPALGTNAMSTQKSKNEAYFAKIGQANADRPDGVAPNQGGKYGGFGSEPDHWRKEDEAVAPPALDDFQKDPVAALTKGFGWLGASVSKVGKTGYEGWVKPGMQKVCCSEVPLLICLKVINLTMIAARRSRPRNPSPTHSRNTRSNTLFWRRKCRHNFQPFRRRRVVHFDITLDSRTREERLLGFFWRRAKGACEG